jgi:cell division protein FtsB
LMHEIVGHLYDETQRKLTNAENQNRQMRLTRWRLTLFVSFGFP